MDWQLGTEELAAQLKSTAPPRLLDVREPEEFEIARLPGARLIPLGQLPFRLAEIEDWRTEEIVVYCHHGVRSMRALWYMREAGFGRLRNLAGGIEAWSLEVDSSVPRY